MVRTIALAALCVALAACGHMPRHENVRADAPTTISVMSGPSFAEVFLNGALIGTTDEDGVMEPVAVKEGSHDLRVVSRGTEILNQTVFLADGTHRKIALN